MTYLPPPQPVLNSDILIHGDVEIHPTASLAPGVILQAAPHHKIVIGANVCVGMGVILNAGQGSITVEHGVTLGSGVLIVGESKIGNNACIGTATTIFQASVAPMTVINPGSIVGDISRELSTQKPALDSTTQKIDNSPSNNKSNLEQNSASFNDNQVQTNGVESANGSSNVTSDSPLDFETAQNKDGVEKQQGSVVGQAYINQLLVTLFPHKKAFDSNSKNTTPDSQ